MKLIISEINKIFGTYSSKLFMPYMMLNPVYLKFRLTFQINVSEAKLIHNAGFHTSSNRVMATNTALKKKP